MHPVEFQWAESMSWKIFDLRDYNSSKNNEYQLVALKMCAPGRAHMEKHYADLKKKPFFKDLVDYMISGPVVCMVWEGLGAVKCGRMMLGETNPQASLPGSIRGDMSIQVSSFCSVIYVLQLYQGRTQHLPRFRLCWFRQARDCSLVQEGGACQLELSFILLDLRRLRILNSRALFNFSQFWK